MSTINPFWVCVFFICSPMLYAQSNITGIVKSDNGEVLQLANLVLKNTVIGAATNQYGKFTISKVPNGKYVLVCSVLGFETVEKDVVVNDNDEVVNFKVKLLQNELDEVSIYGKSKIKKLKELPYKPEVIEFKEFENSSKTVIEALNTAAGLRIRQQGGIGSDIDISLNGIDGKDVRVFVDEIPVYLLGRGFELKNLTLSMVDRVEIYKGLIPIKFGSDSLGGIINIVTKKDKEKSLEIGNSYGSWNSHEVTLDSYFKPLENKKFYASIDGVYRHSDNDYWMDDVNIVVDELYNTKKGRARRFNDKYDFGLVKLQAGFNDLNWADNLSIISSFTLTNKEWQHGFTAIHPWGETFSKEYTIGAALNWRKTSLKNKKWDVDIIAGYNYEYTYFEDLSKHTYFWDGSYTDSFTIGESGIYNQGRTPEINQRVWYARENISYKINSKLKLNFNFFTSKRKLSGQDKAGTATYETDPFKTPQSLLNNFIGSSLESKFLRGKLISNTSFKHYYTKIKAVVFKVTNEFDKINTSFSSNIGFGQVFKCKILPNLILFPGYEYTVRQPDSEEVFGDYISKRGNPNLKSSTSHNLNFNTQYNLLNKMMVVRLGLFYRNTKNRILPTTLSNILVTYSNFLHTSSVGSELGLELKLNKKLNLSLNATYIDTRLRGVDEFGILTKEYIGARIPNTPYLFGNFQSTYILKPKKHNKYFIRFINIMSYVNEFFRAWEINGVKSSKTTIPSQFVNDFSIIFVPKNRRWRFAFDCKNLTDAKVYDNFSVQKPGRSLYGKITYLFIN
ncbi:MAG: TonB-dependent receptor [Flavobacteriaceae bacterium]|nr:TonB-dependent receptor [Flavobacteriaceae bacterium]